MGLDPREPTTWSDLADHPAFDASLDPNAWSSQPEMYETERVQSFMPEWYAGSAQPLDPAECQQMTFLRLKKGRKRGIQLKTH